MKLTHLKPVEQVQKGQPEEQLQEAKKDRIEFSDEDSLMQAKRDFAIEQTKKSKHAQHAAHKISKFD